MNDQKERLDRVNAHVEDAFSSLEGCLDHYRRKLPARVGNYHQEEVGPIYHHAEPGEADKFVEGRFRLGEAEVDMSGGLNWFAAPGGDLEWNGGLVRHGHFMLLANAYEETGDERYAQTIITHILNYIHNVPPFDPEGKPYLEYKKSTWRPFEVACRAAETWPESLAKIIHSPHMTPEAWAEILYSTYQHACFLRKHHWQVGNHATLEVADLGIISIFYPEFRESYTWRQYAIEFMESIWPDQFHKDGYTREMSGSYHWVAMRSFFSFYEVALNNGYGNEFSDEYVSRLRLNCYAEFYQDKPDSSTPVSNDSSSRINRRAQLDRMRKLLELPEIDYVLSESKEGSQPPQTSVFYEDSRIGIMRSDWSREARYLYFDMGRWGDNHMNQDQLSIEVSAFGRHFLMNGGKWRYTTSDPDADWMPLAKYFKATASYNCVLVNGYNQVFGDAAGHMKTHRDYDFAKGTFDAGFGEEVPGRDEKLFRERGLATKMETRVDAQHTRYVFFVKPWFWIIRDEIDGDHLKHIEQLWHFQEGSTLRPLDTPKQSWTTEFPDANLYISCVGDEPVTANTYMGQQEPFIAGWHCPYYDVLKPAPELRFRTTGDRHIALHTLIYPYRDQLTESPKFNVFPDSYEVSLNNKSWIINTKSNDNWKLQ